MSSYFAETTVHLLIISFNKKFTSIFVYQTISGNNDQSMFSYNEGCQSNV